MPWNSPGLGLRQDDDRCRFWKTIQPQRLLFVCALSLSLHCQAAVSVTRQLDHLILPISAIMRAELGLIPTPEQALKQAINYRSNGQYGEARVTALHGMYLADADSSIYIKLLDEIDFELPVLQVKEWLISGHTGHAKHTLDLLAERYLGDDGHTAQIESLQGSLVSANKLQSMQKMDERGVMNAVRRVMRDYYAEHKIYPPNYRVLNEILPPQHEVLQNFEIIYFRSGLSEGYQLVLRNRDNHENLLTISATGLLK